MRVSNENDSHPTEVKKADDPDKKKPRNHYLVRIYIGNLTD